MIKPLAFVLLVGALLGAWQWREAVVDQRGYDRAVAERKQQDDEHLAEATTNARAAEIALRDKIDSDSIERQKEKAAYETTIDDLRTAARDGDSGMRAPGPVCPDTAPPSPGTPGRPVDQKGHKLLPETSVRVLDAAADLAQGVRERNALIDLYNQCRATANAP